MNKNIQSFTSIDRQRGASLIETLSYLGVAAVIIGGAAMLISNAFSGANSNRSVQEIVSLQIESKKLFMGQQAGYGTTSFNDTLIAAKKIPSTLKVSAPSTITNSWNGAVVLSGATGGTTFTISYASVPQEVCVDILTALGTQNWTGLTVNGTARSVPVTPANATTWCAAGSNTVMWHSS